MSLYNFLEKPKVYNLINKILSLGKEYCEKCLLELIDSRPDNLLLDVGCGTGKYAELLPGSYYGVDINEDYIKFARKNYKGNFLVMDATDLKFPDNKFDFVFNVGVFHHVTDDQVKRALDEMKRVCKKRGGILVIEPVFPSKLNFIGYLLFKFDRGDYTRNLEDLGVLMGNEGFELIKDKIEGCFPHKVCVFGYQKQ